MKFNIINDTTVEYSRNCFLDIIEMVAEAFPDAPYVIVTKDGSYTTKSRYALEEYAASSSIECVYAHTDLGVVRVYKKSLVADNVKRVMDELTVMRSFKDVDNEFSDVCTTLRKAISILTYTYPNPIEVITQDNEILRLSYKEFENLYKKDKLSNAQNIILCGYFNNHKIISGYTSECGFTIQCVNVHALSRFTAKLKTAVLST